MLNNKKKYHDDLEDFFSLQFSSAFSFQEGKVVIYNEIEGIQPHIIFPFEITI